MQFPASELEWWSLYFSIDNNKDKPEIVRTPTENKQAFKELMSYGK